MGNIHSLQGDWRSTVAIAVGYGLLIALVLPAGVTVLDDDFGYLRSVVQTLQRGRPWTDDWLEPWAASFSSLAAILYRATGSFTVATHGLLILLAAVACAGLLLLFRDRGMTSKVALAAAVAVLTFPTVLWKTVQFTGLALYLPCLLLALWAQARRQWTCFAIVWILALATRQSAVAWGTIPLIAAWQAFRTPGAAASAGLRPVLVLIGGIIAFASLSSGMNLTHSQSVLTTQAFAHIELRHVLRGLALGMFAGFWAVGVGGFMLRLRKSSRAPATRSQVQHVLFLLLWIGLMIPDVRTWTVLEHTLLSGTVGWIYAKLAVTIALVGWWWGGFTVRWTQIAIAAAALLLVCVRPTIWDYYLLDVVVIAFFSVVPRLESGQASPMSAAMKTIAVIVAGFHGVFILDLKSTVDRAHALGTISEIALREGRLRPDEISFAPFGFIGWQLHSHYRHHEGANSADIAGFGRYLRMGAVEVGQGYSRPLHVLHRFQHEPPGDRSNLIRSGRGRFLWIFQAEFFLLRFKSPGDAPVETDLRDYVRPFWPMDDHEWDKLIDKKEL